MSGPAPEAAAPAAEVFAALGDGTRLRLVLSLSREGPQSITRLCAGERVTRQAVTKHLGVLARAGLASSARVGRQTIWQLDPARLESARESLDQISAQWDSALARLKHFVEGDGAQEPGERSPRM